MEGLEEDEQYKICVGYTDSIPGTQLDPLPQSSAAPTWLETEQPKVVPHGGNWKTGLLGGGTGSKTKSDCATDREGRQRGHCPFSRHFEDDVLVLSLVLGWCPEFFVLKRA